MLTNKNKIKICGSGETGKHIRSLQGRTLFIACGFESHLSAFLLLNIICKKSTRGIQMETISYKRMDATPQNMTIQRLLLDLSDNKIKKNPSFQREYVWNTNMQRELIFSIAFGNPIGAVTLWRQISPNNTDNIFVVDGLQRLTTIENYCNNKFYICGKQALGILNYYQKYIMNAKDSIDSKSESQKAKTLLTKMSQNNPKLYFQDFIERMRVDFMSQEIAIINIHNSSEEDIRAYFLRIQNQEKLKAGEIINAIDSNVLEKILKEIKDPNTNHIKIKSDLGFNSDRNEFEKIYYSMIAILEGKLSLGAKDDQIVKYVEEIDKRAQEFEENTDLKALIANINSNLKDISDLNIKEHIGRTNLKFLIFLAAKNFYGLKSKYSIKDIMQGFVDVCSRFKAFHSYDTRSEKLETAFQEFSDIDKETLDMLKKDYEQISMLRKGSHRLDKFEKRMQKLSELISMDIIYKNRKRLF